MVVIPAIDIRDGICVRLTQGKFEEEIIFSREPVAMARLWKRKRARRLHIVDLDGAYVGIPQNLEVVSEIVKKVNIPVQMGGGIRDLETLEEVFNYGVQWAILGTSACASPDFVRVACEKYPDRILVGIDAKDGMVAVKGWREITSIKATELGSLVKEMGINTVIFTDIYRDGMLSGPNIQSIKEFVQTSKLKVITSGGISSLKDIENLKLLESLGLEGLIIGKALYTGLLDLEEAIKLAGS
jgi:phosphoribosylformimino-5-aminoimidazole carboxamide ribotide isomerase